MARYFTEEHEWIDVEGDTATVGITAYAVVESVKAASDVYAPITGEVTEANDALDEDPALVNSSPEESGWFFKLTIADKGELDGLMDADAYKSFCDGL